MPRSMPVLKEDIGGSVLQGLALLELNHIPKYLKRNILHILEDRGKATEVRRVSFFGQKGHISRSEKTS